MSLVPLILDIVTCALVCAYWSGFRVGPAAGAVLVLTGALVLSFPERFPTLRLALDPRPNVEGLHRRIRIWEGLAMILLGLFVAARPQAATTRDVALGFLAWLAPSAVANLLWWVRDGRKLEVEDLRGWPRIAALLQGEQEKILSHVRGEVVGGALNLVWIGLLAWIARPVSLPDPDPWTVIPIFLLAFLVIAVIQLRRRRDAELLRLRLS